ncbi:MAG: hypothetical protein A4E73_01202 [Syntrophaceae bacterium PtaU1.Bin231]|nr:MAG: hypothetical protein A4E73_01202 [Syntrophaceae bacterium PtaU1.Bin231]
MPRDLAASNWPSGSESIAPRTISAAFPAAKRLIAIAAEGKVPSLIPSAGRPKKMKNICMMSGVSRVISTMRFAG